MRKSAACVKGQHTQVCAKLDITEVNAEKGYTLITRRRARWLHVLDLGWKPQYSETRSIANKCRRNERCRTSTIFDWANKSSMASATSGTTLEPPVTSSGSLFFLNASLSLLGSGNLGLFPYALESSGFYRSWHSTPSVICMLCWPQDSGNEN